MDLFSAEAAGTKFPVFLTFTPLLSELIPVLSAGVAEKFVESLGIFLAVARGPVPKRRSFVGRFGFELLLAGVLSSAGPTTAPPDAFTLSADFSAVLDI